MIFDKTINNENYIKPPPCYYDEIINNIDGYKHLRILNLFICIKYADIIIDLTAKNIKLFNLILILENQQMTNIIIFQISLLILISIILFYK